RMVFSLSISLPPPALRECCHRGLARLSVAVGRRAILVVPKSERPHPRRAYWRGVDLQDAANHGTVGKHVEVVVVPLPRWTRDRRLSSFMSVPVGPPRESARATSMGVGIGRAESLTTGDICVEAAHHAGPLAPIIYRGYSSRLFTRWSHAMEL